MLRVAVMIMMDMDEVRGACRPVEDAAMTRSRIIFLLVVVAVLGGQDTALARYGRRGRRGGGGFGGTAASSAMLGYSQLLRAAGQANVMNSTAAINWEKAKQLEIQNRALWTQTYFSMRKLSHDMRLAEAGPPVTAEQAARMAKAAMAPPLDSRELDPHTGRIAYPAPLRESRYDSLRADVDDFFARRATGAASIDGGDLRQLQTILELLHAELQSHVNEYEAGEYGHAVIFLDRLWNDARSKSR